MKRRILTLLFSLILMLSFATPALAQGPGGAQVLFGENLVVEDGQTLDRDVVVFGGNVTVRASSTINGDLVVFGGTATIDGTVKGDIGMIGGNLNLGESGLVEGDVGLVGGQINRAEGATIEGQVQNLNRFEYDYGENRRVEDDEGDGIPAVPPVPRGPDFSKDFDGFSPFRWVSRAVSDIFWNASLLIVLGLISWLVAAFMPGQMITVRETVTQATPTSFGFGLLTSVIVALSFLLVLTICLAFIPFLAGLVVGVAMLFGWIVIGQIIGERLLAANGNPQPDFYISTIVGVAVLTIVTNMPVIGEIPCIGFLLSLIGSVIGLVVGLTGLGAVLLTRFGTRPYPPQSPSFGGGPTPSSGLAGNPYSGNPDDDDDLGVAPASEAELNARIKAALAETERTNEGPEEETPETPDEGPDPAEPTPEAPNDENPEDDPHNNPKSGSS